VFPAEDGDPVVVGGEVSGRLDDGTYARTHALAGNAGEVIDVSLTARDGNLDTYLILIGPDGREIARNDDRSRNRSDAALVQVELPETGEYTLVATRWRQQSGYQAGDYTLTVRETTSQDQAPSPLTRLISYQVTREGTIDDQNFVDAYTFAGAKGDMIDITMFAIFEFDVDTFLDTSLVLTDSFGNELTANEDINPIDNFEAAIYEFVLPYDGYYTILATRFDGKDGTSSGSYELSLNKIGTEPNAPQFAYLDSNQSLTLLDDGYGLLTYGYFVGDVYGEDTVDVPGQTILTYYLPPIDGESVTNAVLDLTQCDTIGVNWGALGSINVYAEQIEERIDGGLSFNPTSNARLLASLENCGRVDVTNIIQQASDAGISRLQFRLAPQATNINGNEDAVIFLAPQLRYRVE